MKDIPGYALISGGEYNGCYTRHDEYYRLSDGHLFNIRSGNLAGSKQAAAPAPEPELEPEAETAAVAEAPAPEAIPVPADAAPELSLEERIDAVCADYDAKTVKAMLKKLKEGGAKVTIDNARTAKATRLNAAELLKHTEG